MVSVVAASTITLALGPHGFRVQCADTQLARQLMTAYQGFIAEIDPEFELEIRIPDIPTQWHSSLSTSDVPSETWPDLQIEANLVSIHEMGRQIRLDLQRRYGYIVVDPSHAFELVDYALRVACALVAFETGGLLLHAAGLSYAGQGYLLIGPSGAGKTTAARNAPAGSVMNDDLMLLMPEDQNWVMYATPFTNPTQVAPNGKASAPLSGIFRLIQAPCIARRPMARAIAAAELVSLTPIVNLDPHRAPTLLRRAHHLAATVPCAYLELLPNPSYWDVLLPAAERTTL